MLGRTPFMKPFRDSTSGERRAVAGTMEAVGIGHLSERCFSALSGGERQKVVLAMALAQETGLVLLDEPTAHLDISHQVEVLELLADTNAKRGMTIIAAMHDLNLAPVPLEAAGHRPVLRALGQRGHGAAREPVTVSETASAQIISHYNLFRSAEINGIAAPGYSSGQAIQAMEEVAQEVLPAGFSFAWSGLAFEEKQSGGTSTVAFAFGLVIVFLVLAAQYE